MISRARSDAFAVLLRVEGGSYASDLLAAKTRDADSRDARLATDVVLGVLRHQAQFDFLVRKITGKPADKLDAEVRTAIRMGMYQLRHLDRVPAHAAISESVELVKIAKKRSAAGLVNAVLRRTPGEAVAWPSRDVEFSMPEWLLSRWESQFGAEVSTGIAGSFLQPPTTYVRNPDGRDGLELETTEVPGAFRVISGNPAGLRIQDLGSQSIVPLLELEPGHSFLDVCSAPGNKTAQALEAGVNGIACDFYLHRLRQVSGCARVVLDARQPLPFRRQFDRVLVDAPCSGTGTLARNPEIRWRLTPSDIGELHDKQVAILKQALGMVKAGGRLVYSTCSLEVEENEAVVKEVIEGSTGFTVSSSMRRTPGIDSGDGFFAAVFVRQDRAPDGR